MNSEPQDPDTQERLAEWTVRYLDGTLEGAELERLDAALESDPGARALFDNIAGQAFALADPEEAALRPDSIETPSAATPWRPIALAATALAAALILALVVLDRSSRSAQPEFIARLVASESVSQLLDDSGTLTRQLAPDTETSLAEGEGVRLPSPTATAEIRFPDGTRVSVTGHAEVRVGRSESGGKRVHVTSGQIEAEVTRQPAGKPLEIVTPTSTIEVLGTRLEVNATAGETLVAVTSGRIALIRQVDGARVEVPAGSQSRSTRSATGPLITESLPEIPDQWEADFAQGLPGGWRCGKWLSETGTILAHPNLENGYNYHSISSSNAWSEGHHSHFQIHPDSVLYLRFRMERPGWFLLMLNLRATSESVRRHGGNVFYQDESWHQDLAPNEWRTLRIPLRDYDKFCKGEYRSRDAVLDGLAAYSVYLTTQARDLGLEVESIRLVREP